MNSYIRPSGRRAIALVPTLLALCVGTAFAGAINAPPPTGAILNLNGQTIDHGKPVPMSVDFNAAMANTAISFAFRDDPAYISFGDVSLLDLTTGASSNLLANGNFSGGTYQDQKGQLAPMGWSYGNSNGAQFAGMVSSSPYACAGFSSGNCWYDGSMMAYDTLSQGVATNVGDRYQLSFMYSENSHQSLFSSLSNNGLSGRAGNGIDIAAYAKAGVPGGPDVPEPGSLALFAAGLLGLALFLRAQRRRSY